MRKQEQVRLGGKLNVYLRWPVIIIIFLLIMNIAVYFVNMKAGIIVSVFSIVYIVILSGLLRYYRPTVMNEMIAFASQYGQIQKQLLEEFSIPYALVDTDGRLMWMNAELGKLTGKDKNYHKNILNLFPEIDARVLPLKDTESMIEVTCDEHDYRVEMRKVSIESLEKAEAILTVPEEQNYMIALYFFDITALNESIRENQKQKMVTGLIYLDNYDEALESVEEVRRSLLVALIDRKINKYISSLDGIVKKIEKDKYFIVIKYQSLQELEANRFSLLEEVKAVNIGNDMSVTLSIGIGVNGSGYIQNYEFSRIAIEMALGRSGDQAVVKDIDKISYYGGKSQQMEKNTRVKARVKAHALREFISAKDEVVIMGHQIIDVDAFGAAIGMYRAAKTIDKKAHIVLGDINSSIRPWVSMFLDSSDYKKDMFINHEEAKAMVDDNTVVIVVDTNKPSITECAQLLEQTKTVVVLDHHRQGGEVIKNAVLSYIEPFASSACEMVAEILQYFSDSVRLRNCEADCIYAGIIVDTNNFVAKTGVRTFEAAAFLRRSGADVTRVRKMFRNDMDSYKARAEAVRHAEVFMDSYAISVCPGEHLENATVVGAQAANELLNITGVKASFVITEYNKRIYISARSIDEVNVQIIMERIGGGGHISIAGAQLDHISAEQAKEKLQEIIITMTEEGAI